MTNIPIKFEDGVAGRTTTPGAGEVGETFKTSDFTAVDVDKAIDDVGFERGLIPNLAIDRYHIDMPIEKQRRSNSSSLYTADQVRPSGLAFKDTRLNSISLKQITNIGDAGRFISGGIGRVEPN